RLKRPVPPRPGKGCGKVTTPSYAGATPCAQEEATFRGETQRHATRTTTIGAPTTVLARPVTHSRRVISARSSAVAETNATRLRRERLGQTFCIWPCLPLDLTGKKIRRVGKARICPRLSSPQSARAWREERGFATPYA